MTLYEISVKQKELDDRIWELHQESSDSTCRKRILALLVELGELANETRCFKFWSNKASSERDVILDEYVDGIHFIVSLGNDLAIDFKSIEYRDTRTIARDLYEEFLCVYQDATDLLADFSETTYLKFLETYMNLGIALGFTFDDVVRGYLKKNAVNHERQSSNY